MEMLIFFAIWAALIVTTMRFHFGAHVVGDGQGLPGGSSDENRTGRLRWIPPATDTDPVCGKTVKTANAKSCVHDGDVYYFCSRDCRELFEAAPGLYDGSGDSGQSNLEYSHA